MTRWIVLVAAVSLVACGGAVESEDDGAPAADANVDTGADAAPYSICGTGKSLCSPGAGRLVCTDLQVDAENCGACRTQCAVGQVCSAGACR